MVMLPALEGYLGTANTVRIMNVPVFMGLSMFRTRIIVQFKPGGKIRDRKGQKGVSMAFPWKASPA
jgi:hypothetical protein